MACNSYLNNHSTEEIYLYNLNCLKDIYNIDTFVILTFIFIASRWWVNF